MLWERILDGDVRAGARLMRLADDREPAAREALDHLFHHTGKAHVVGITGNPGAGKSTLVDKVVHELRKRERRVGIVAIDPSSPFSGGAILGDRIRMQRHATDPDVFIRSLGTRGHLGGLSRSTSDCVTVLDALGFDTISTRSQGISRLVDEILGHEAEMKKSGEWARREARRVHAMLTSLVQETLLERIEQSYERMNDESCIERKLLERSASPYRLADELMALLPELAKGE